MENKNKNKKNLRGGSLYRCEAYRGGGRVWVFWRQDAEKAGPTRLQNAL